MITNYNIVLEILPAIPINTYGVPIDVVVVPSIAANRDEKIYGVTIQATPLVINISTPIKETAYNFLSEAFNSYIDEDRELKTLLNYGEDRQSVIVASRYGETDQVGVRTVQLKLLQPVPDDIASGDRVFLSREVAQTVIDTTRIRFAPEIDDTPYLRPRNTSVKTNTDLGKSLKNVTLQLLSVQTGSVGAYTASNNVTFDDAIYRRWYSHDFNSSELNIDFSDYNNFVFYGSAAMRLQAFREKIKSIESLDEQSRQFTGGIFTGSLASAGAAFIVNESARVAKEKENIIRSFDRYEQYLFFTPSGSNSPYSASAYYADNNTEYNSLGYWPKDANGNLYSWVNPVAEDWFETQLIIAQNFDNFNENNLINTIPTHIREDDDSQSYVTFVAMIGHFFDTIKPYVDQFPNIYSRYINPNEELSKDLVVNIAESVGFQLPTLNSIYSLSDNVLGTTSESPRRDFTVETHKRLLHNLPYFAKSKGTKTALSTLIKTFGISEQLIDIVESGTATTASYYVFDEFSTGLSLGEVSNQYVQIPILASNRTPAPRSLQLNCTVAEARNQTIITGDSKWALNVSVHPTNTTLGRFELTSGSTNSIILTSSYEPIFGDELINVSIRTFDTGSYANLFVCQVEGEDIIFSSSMSETYGANVFVPLWSSSNNVNIGGSGSLVVDGYIGTIDEVRLWGINLSNEMTLNTAFDPGSNAGDAYTDASDYLYVQLSFDRILTASLPYYVTNESPYKGKDGSPSLEEINIYNIDLTDFTRYNRTVRQLLPDIGSSAYVTKKIHIAPPASFSQENLTRQGVKQLSRTRSIVNPAQKRVQRGRNKISISTSPTRIINQNIIRNLGLENINSVLGSPTDLYKTFDKTLDTLKRHYAQYYYVDVNINQYIRILSEVNSVLGQVVEYFIPSKATLLKGVVIEPNILERVKVPPIKNLRFYGKSARRTKNAAASLTGSNADYEATFNLSKTIHAVVNNTTSGSFDSYTSQVVATHDPVLIVSSSMLKTSISGSLESLAGNYNTFAYQHENWLESALISESIKPPRPATIQDDEYSASAAYETFTNTNNLKTEKSLDGNVVSFDKQSEDWYTTKLVSQSLRPQKYSAIEVAPIVSASYNLEDLQTLSWYENYLVSNSLIPHKKQRIDVGLSNMNKIPYNDVNNGSEGAEPYNRLYTRKLFDYEINKTRVGGVKSIYVQGLYDIPPAGDFNEVGSYTYFNSPSGIYYYPVTKFEPKYTQVFNQEWNGTQFVGAPTWSYGSSYNINDVVYQQVDKPYTNILNANDTLEVTNSGNNSALTSWNITYPEYNVGDLIIFHVAWDDSANASIISKPSGPGGESVVDILTDYPTISAAQRIAVWYWVAKTNESGGTYTVTTDIAESHTATVVRVPNGSFNTVEPIGAVATSQTTTSQLTIASPTFNISGSDTHGTLCTWIGCDTVIPSETPTGWTAQASVDRGVVGGTFATRNALVDQDETIPQYTWTLPVVETGAIVSYIIKSNVQYVNAELSTIYPSARLGNGKYYVFKTRPSYQNPLDGTTWYSGSVPTYLPPSLDRENWSRVRFRPFELREARRIVFDTFTVPDPSLNNYITTTIDVNKIIDIPDRYVDVNTIGNVSANDYQIGELAVQNIAALFAIQSNNTGIRIRLYRTDVSRDADIARSIETAPSEGSGVLLDMQVYNENQITLINPIATLVADSNPPLGKIYYTINNTTAELKTDVVLIMYYFALEIEPRVPIGYLRKHYRFFRDNSTAKKRRNYLGCKNTEDTTIDGLPPIQIFLSEGTDIVVSPTQTNDEIITGGGGTLDVT